MAGTPGGLTTSIRRKLQDGKTPEDIIKELVAGGLTETSAQRFVDRAVAEHASAEPLPPLPETPAPIDSLDQFLQTKTAESAAEAAKTGRKQLWIASSLMCGGIAITAISYMMAAPGGRFTLMWGPVVFGGLLYGQAVIKGLTRPRSFAWFSALGAGAAPVVLAVVLLGVMIALEPAGNAQTLAEAGGRAQPASSDPRAVTVSNPASSPQPSVEDLLIHFENNFDNPAVQCDVAKELARMTGDDAVDAVDGLMEHYENVPEPVKKCVKDTVTRLDPAAKFP